MDGRYSIHMEHVNLEEILEECKKAIARYPTEPSFESDHRCEGKDQHSVECLVGMEDLLQPCIKVEAEKAEQRLKQLLFLSRLKDCARNPTKANALDTLKGIARGQ